MDDFIFLDPHKFEVTYWINSPLRPRARSGPSPSHSRLSSLDTLWPPPVLFLRVSALWLRSWSRNSHRVCYKQQTCNVLIRKHTGEMQNSSLEFEHVGFGTSYDLGMGVGFAILSVLGKRSMSLLKLGQKLQCIILIFQVALEIF